MNKKTVVIFVFDGMADWEFSYAAVGINRSGAYNVKTIAMKKSPIRTMGGITIVPDLDFIPSTDLDDLDFSNTAMLILPGGDAWREMKNLGIASLVYHCVENRIPVAAICDSVLFLARLGLLDKVNHTANDPSDLTQSAPNYVGGELFQKAPSVLDRHTITAQGTAAVEFAGDIFDLLNISENDEVKQWFQYFQNKMVDY